MSDERILNAILELRKNGPFNTFNTSIVVYNYFDEYLTIAAGAQAGKKLEIYNDVIATILDDFGKLIDGSLRIETKFYSKSSLSMPEFLKLQEVISIIKPKKEIYETRNKGL